MNIKILVAASLLISNNFVATNNTTSLFNAETIAEQYNISVETVKKTINHAYLAMQPASKLINIIADEPTIFKVTRQGIGILETAYGRFYLFNFEINDNWKRYSVLVKASLDDNFSPIFKNSDHVTLRVDSGCLTGQLFGDRTCECKQQLEKSMLLISQLGEGLVICIPEQDGRGMGISFKLATLLLQNELGINTVESASLLTNSSVIDIRTYTGAVAILKYLGITTEKKLSIATNNSKKIAPFIANGYKIDEAIPVIIEPTEYTKHHLEAKKQYLGHNL